MSTPVLSVLPDTPARLAAKLFGSHGYSTLPVVDAEDRLLGVLTETELLTEQMLPQPRALAGDDRPLAICPPMTVWPLMKTDVLTTGPDTQVTALARLMLDYDVHAILIIDAGVLVGIVTRRDLLRLVARDDQVIARDVHSHLSASGRRHWQVTVADGMVKLHGEGANETERHVATVVAGSLPGVVGVHVVDPAV